MPSEDLENVENWFARKFLQFLKQANSIIDENAFSVFGEKNEYLKQFREARDFGDSIAHEAALVKAAFDALMQRLKEHTSNNDWYQELQKQIDDNINPDNDNINDNPDNVESDEDILNSEPIFGEKYRIHSKDNKQTGSSTDEQSESRTNYDFSENSKEKYFRLNPYLENIIAQLRLDFDGYELPNDIYHKLAEAHSITGRADIWSSQLLLTITKLRPLLLKKLGINWTELKRILNKIVKKVLSERCDNYTLDTIPAGLWFFGDEPKSRPMDILLAAKRIQCQIMYDEWADVCRVTVRNRQ